jgi:hypothetical protein
MVETWIALSPRIGELEEREDLRQRMEGTMDDQEREGLGAEIEERFGDLRTALWELRADLM